MTTPRNNAAQKATIHQVSTMLATSKNVLFLGHNHLLTTSTDDPTILVIARWPARVIIKVSGYQMVMTWKYDILRSRLYGGYLVDNVFLHSIDFKTNLPSCVLTVQAS